MNLLVFNDKKNIDRDLSHEEECDDPKKIIVKRKPVKCPICGFKPVATILYGFPAFSPELDEEIKAGKTTLGGCSIYFRQPRWECSKCGTLFYKDSDMNFFKGWNL